MKNQTVKFWKNNKLDQEYELTYEKILKSFETFIDSKEVLWLKGYPISLVIADFVGSSTSFLGLESVGDIDNPTLILSMGEVVNNRVRNAWSVSHTSEDRLEYVPAFIVRDSKGKTTQFPYVSHHGYPNWEKDAKFQQQKDWAELKACLLAEAGRLYDEATEKFPKTVQETISNLKR